MVIFYPNLNCYCKPGLQRTDLSGPEFFFNKLDWLYLNVIKNKLHFDLFQLSGGSHIFDNVIEWYLQSLKSNICYSYRITFKYKDRFRLLTCI